MVGSMQDDDTLTVTGKYISCLTLTQFQLFTEGEPAYPEMLTVTSTEEAAEKYPDSLGEYQLQNISLNRHPVYQSLAREDRYITYIGKN